MSNPEITSALMRSTISRFTAWVYAVNSASAVNAAEPIENPFPIAAVVFPTESKWSVIFLTSSPAPDISAIPPALSAIGP